MKLTQNWSSQIDRHTQNKCTSYDIMVKWTCFRVHIQFAEDKCRKPTFLKNQVLNDLEQNKKDNTSPA